MCAVTMNIFGRVGVRSVRDVRGLLGSRQRGEEPGGRPLALSLAVEGSRAPQRAPCAEGLFLPCLLRALHPWRKSVTAPWTRRPAPLPPSALTALGLCGPTCHWSTRGAPSPRRGPSQALGAGTLTLGGRSHTSRTTQSRPLRNPSLCPPPAASRCTHAALTPLPAEAARVTPALHSARGCCYLVPLPWPRDACLAAYPTFKGIPRKLRVLMLL